MFDSDGLGKLSERRLSMNVETEAGLMKLKNRADETEMKKEERETIRVYQFSFRVSEDVLDENGHVNNVVYVQWMQDAATKHAEAAGCLQATKAAGATWVARSHQIEYLRPLYAGDEVCVMTWVSDFRKLRSLRKYKFIRPSDNVVLAQGATEWVLMDIQSKRPRRISEEVKGALMLVPEAQEP